MCTVSMVGDHYMDIWKDIPHRPAWPAQPVPFPPQTITIVQPGEVTRAEFDQLKRQVEEMVALLKRAKAYDEANNEPDCELEDKMNFLREVARRVGVDLDAQLAK
jgi:hypothetical protein